MDANPRHEMKVWDLLKTGQYEEAETLYHSVYDDVMRMAEEVGQRSGGQSTVLKGLSEILGHSLGDPRPPSRGMNEAEKTKLRTLVLGWGWDLPH